MLRHLRKQFRSLTNRNCHGYMRSVTNSIARQKGFYLYKGWLIIGCLLLYCAKLVEIGSKWSNGHFHWACKFSKNPHIIIILRHRNVLIGTTKKIWQIGNVFFLVNVFVIPWWNSSRVIPHHMGEKGYNNGLLSCKNRSTSPLLKQVLIISSSSSVWRNMFILPWRNLLIGRVSA